ncbi:MAG TPA: hypothetical protein V6D19_07800 [Stenomitos sp.]
MSEASKLSPTSQVISPLRRLSLGLLQRWWVAAIALTGCAVGLGGLGTWLLIRQPPTPNCERVFWPFASASFRVYCAQEAARGRTLESLFEAIALVDVLPSDHPLRPMINHWINIWSKQALDLAEDEFNQGNLDRAIYFAKKIPAQTTAHALVQQRIQYWQKVWSQGDKIFRQVEAALNREDWREAFSIMIRLMTVDNRYWAQTQYEKLNQRIIQAQKDETQLVKAKRLLEAGGLDNLTKALEMLQDLAENSIFRKSIQKTITEIARSLVKVAESALADQDLNTALNALEQIPQSVSFWSEVEDWKEIAHAMSATWSGDVAGYQSAIDQLRKMSPRRPLYLQAQTYIQKWSADIAYVGLLGEARARAAEGSNQAIAAAIDAARQIPSDSTQWREAQQAISEWSSSLRVQQDQPILNQADDLSFRGDAASLQAAIREAQRIPQGSDLYEDAQGRIRDWRDQLQQLSRPDASFVAAPSVESPAEPDQESQRLWQDAQDLAQKSTPTALASAIDTANQIADGSRLRGKAQQAIKDWGNQMLELATSRSRYDLTEAIAIAQQIPATAPAYEPAQQQIRVWQEAAGQ